MPCLISSKSFKDSAIGLSLQGKFQSCHAMSSFKDSAIGLSLQGLFIFFSLYFLISSGVYEQHLQNYLFEFEVSQLKNIIAMNARWNCYAQESSHIM
jgi:hypothetical protein